jgi:hypothetical protein
MVHQHLVISIMKMKKLAKKKRNEISPEQVQGKLPIKLR